MKFSKPPTFLDQQVDILISRGMEVPDREQAKFYLQHLNYYRLSGYWLPYEASHNPHQFKAGTSFDQIIASDPKRQSVALWYEDAHRRG